MRLHLAVLFATLYSQVYCQFEADDESYQILKAELQFIDFGLEEYCDELSTKRLQVLLDTSTYNEKSNFEYEYGHFLKQQSKILVNYTEDDVPPDFTRNYTVITKPGDALLLDNDFKMLVNFSNSNEELAKNTKINVPCEDFQDCKIGKNDYLNTLSTSRNASSLEAAWSEWQDGISPHEEQYPAVLKLVAKAAALNDKYDARAYWEMLADYEDGYSAAKSMWEEIEPFYRKLHNFVLVRINEYYNENFTDIPVYLLGSNFGEDWSNIAGIIMPHPQILHDIKIALGEKSVEDIYQISEDTLKKLRFDTFGKQFWMHSIFNASECQPHLLSFCSAKFTEIITCSRVDMSTYFAAHESSLDIGLRSKDYVSHLRQELRQSFLDSAVINLGSVFALHNLPYYDMLERDFFTEHESADSNRMSALLLTALRVLPRLPYYLAADLWRLDELENSTGDMTLSWWESRKMYQGVVGVTNAEPDYLGDPVITSNKPYLSKFLGTLLLFQILNYYQLPLFNDPTNLAEHLGEDDDFSAIMNERNSKGPLGVLSYNYGIDEVNAYSLLEYFRPLEDYFDSAPLEQAPVVQKARTTKPAPVPVTEEATKETTVVDSATEEILTQNDEQAPDGDTDSVQKNVVLTDEEVKTVAANTAHSPGIYVAIAVGACAVVAVVAFFIKKAVVRRRPRTNNRRFET